MKKLLPIVILSAFCSSCRTYQPAWDMLSNEEKSILETSFGKIVYKENNGYYTNDIILSNSNHNELTLTLMPTIRTNTDFNSLVEIANIFSLGLFSLTGIPMAKYESNATLNLELTPYSNLSLDSYHGTGSAYTACYYGYSPNNAVKQSVSNAIYSALKKIAIDQSKEENQTQLANKIKQEQEKEAKAIAKEKEKEKQAKLKAIEKEKQAKLKAIENEKREKELDNFILNTVPNNVDEVFRHAWTKSSKKDVFTKDEELTQENNLNKKKFEEWVKEKNGNTFLLFEEKAKIDTYTSDLEYNPNTEELTVIPDKIVPKGFLTLKSDSEGLGSYIGENAFGVKKEITRIDYTIKGIEITNNNFKIRKRKKIKFSTEELRKISDHLKFLYVMTSSGEEKYSSDYKKATISDPREIFTHEAAIKGKIEQVYLYDALNKKIIMKMIER